MNVRVGQYDPELQMFTDQPRELNLGHLKFLRWLSERGRLEHEPIDPPGGAADLPSPGDSSAWRHSHWQ